MRPERSKHVHCLQLCVDICAFAFLIQRFMFLRIAAASLQIDQNSRNMYIVDASADSVVIASLDLPNITSTLHSQNIYAIEELVLSPILGLVR